MLIWSTSESGEMQNTEKISLEIVGLCTDQESIKHPWLLTVVVCQLLRVENGYPLYTSSVSCVCVCATFSFFRSIITTTKIGVYAYRCTHVHCSNLDCVNPPPQICISIPPCVQANFFVPLNLAQSSGSHFLSSSFVWLCAWNPSQWFGGRWQAEQLTLCNGLWVYAQQNALALQRRRDCLDSSCATAARMVIFFIRVGSHLTESSIHSLLFFHSFIH